MNNLPTDILKHVCGYFDPKTVGRLLVNKKLASQADLFYGSIQNLTIRHRRLADTMIKKCTGAVSLCTDCEFSTMTKLKKLKIRDAEVTSDMVKVIESLNLQEIDVPTHPELIEILLKIDVIHSTFYTKLSIKYKDIAFTSLKLYIRSDIPVLNPTKLTKLEILEYKSADQLYEIFSALKLQILILRTTFIQRPKTNFDLSRIAHMPLHKLHIERMSISPVSIDTLRELSLYYVTVDLGELKCLKHLQILSLVSCKTIGELSITLHKLDLNSVSFAPFKNTTPAILKCNTNDITDEDITMPLTELHLMDCKLSGRSLPLTITKLKFYRVPVTTEGMHRISQMPLRWLGLSNCGIKGQDLHLLTNLKLHTLDISTNKIDIEYLRVLRHMKLQTFEFDTVSAELLKLL